MNSFKILIGTSFLILSLSVAYYLVIYTPNFEKQKLEIIKNESQTTNLKDSPTMTPNAAKATPQNNNNLQLSLIITNYKVDSNKNISLIESLLTALNNNPTGVCSSIITNVNSRNHIYYIYLDYVSNLEKEYNQYRTTIPYVGNDLDGKYITINMIKDKCSSVGSRVP